jgi:hypothetical protein
MDIKAQNTDLLAVSLLAIVVAALWSAALMLVSTRMLFASSLLRATAIWRGKPLSAA